MKKINRVRLSLLALWLCCLAALALPGVLRPAVELYWTLNPTNENVLAYRIYYKTNLADPDWIPLTTRSPDVTNQFISPDQAGRFYVITASNVWGETPFSAAVWVPLLPSSNGLFQLR